MYLLHLLTFSTKRWWSRYIPVGSVGVEYSLRRRLLMAGFRQFVLLHILRHLAAKLFSDRAPWSQFAPMTHSSIYGGLGLATRVTWHCCFCCLLMRSISSSKHNTGDYQGHEGDVMHHLAPTNWTVSLWRDETRTRANSSRQRCPGFFHLIIVFIYLFFIFFYTLIHCIFTLKDAVKDISFTHHWDFICGRFILMLS